MGLLTLLESMVLPLLPSPLSMELMLELEDMLPTLPVLSMLPSVRLKLNQKLCMVLMVTMLMDLDIAYSLGYGYGLGYSALGHGYGYGLGYTHYRYGKRSAEPATAEATLTTIKLNPGHAIFYL